MLFPEAFWLPGDEVMVSWDGDKVVLEPLPAERAPLDSKAFWAKIDALGDGDFFPDGLPDDPLLVPDPRKFFDT
jgi:virulence-associated protein VagC